MCSKCSFVLVPERMEPEQKDEYCTCSQESAGYSSGADTDDTEPIAPEPFDMFELQEGSVQAVPEWPENHPEVTGPIDPLQEMVPPLRRSGPALQLDPRVGPLWPESSGGRPSSCSCHLDAAIGVRRSRTIKLRPARFQ